jgi:glutaminyl-peptide cyclotransferase
MLSMRAQRQRKVILGMLLLVLWGAGGACSRTSPATQPPEPPVPGQEPVPATGTPVYGYRVLQTYPHDPAAFTQGLFWADGYLYEGTGIYGESGIRRVSLPSGNVVQSQALDERYFGEGIAQVGRRLIQLTWRGRTGFVYDLDTFQQVGSFRYSGEGWGLTYDGQRLITSNGTSTLTYLDPQTMEVLGQLHVHDTGGPVSALNELEWVAGEIYANVWQTDRIARISPYDGQVTGWIDLAGLLSSRDSAQPVDVLNGIAYDAGEQRLFVTGKLWPLLFHIELVDP